MAESHSAAMQMDALIKQGQYAKAARYATDNRSDGATDADRADANFWFMAFLAGSRSGLDTAVTEQYRLTAASCDNYSRQMEGDFHRDSAIAAIRIRDFEVAWDEILRAAEAHSGDMNRLAALDMVYGRFFAAEYRFGAAVAYHDKAALAWNRLSRFEVDIDEQLVDETWVTNNAYHRLRAAVHLPRESAGSRLFDDYTRVRTKSHDPRQRIIAWLAYHFGTRGLWLGDMLESTIVRLAPLLRRMT